MLRRSFSGIDLVVGVAAVVRLLSILTSVYSTSTDLLQAQGIMPRDKPKPEPGPSRVKKKRTGSPDRRDAKRARADAASEAGAGLDLGVVEISDDEEDEEIVSARVSIPYILSVRRPTLTSGLHSARTASSRLEISMIKRSRRRSLDASSRSLELPPA